MIVTDDHAALVLHDASRFLPSLKPNKYVVFLRNETSFLLVIFKHSSLIMRLHTYAEMSPSANKTVLKRFKKCLMRGVSNHQCKMNSQICNG